MKPSRYVIFLSLDDPLAGLGIEARINNIRVNCNTVQLHSSFAHLKFNLLADHMHKNRR